MNAGKRAGFYTNFDPDTGSWTAPGTVSADFRAATSAPLCLD